jgi:hypothetical protein
MPKKVILRNKSKKNKTKKIKQNNKYSVKRGGWGEELGARFAECTMLSQFTISDNNLSSFERIFSSPMDCFINALQIIGIFDSRTANTLRITTKARENGFTIEEIELIFLFNTKHNCKFMSTSNWEEFKHMINQNLQPGKVTFAGYPGHVFLIGRHNNGVVLYIDPQVSAYCNLDSPECTFLISNQPMWYLLFNAPTPLTPEQESMVVQYLSAPPANAPTLQQMPDVNEVDMPDAHEDEDEL